MFSNWGEHGLSLSMFHERATGEGFGHKMPVFAYKYVDTSMCVQYGNKTSNGITPDPFIYATRPSFKRIQDQILQERVRLKYINVKYCIPP